MRRLESFVDIIGEQQQTRSERVVWLPLSALTPSPVQVRGEFNPEDEEDAGLIASIRQWGILQPLLVTLPPNSRQYRIIDGHRRAAAAQSAGMREVPCIVLLAEEVESAIFTATANLQRRDLNPIEEGRQLLMLIRLSGLSVAEIARKLGKPPRTVQYTISLLNLPEGVQNLIVQGQLTPHQALGCQHKAWGETIAQLAVQHSLSRREIDAIVREIEQDPSLTPQDALEKIGKSSPKGEGRKRKPEKAPPPKAPPREIYEQEVREAEWVSPEQGELLVELALNDGLSPMAFRWAALLLKISTMTGPVAIAYARQLVSSPVGRALEGMMAGLAALEKHVSQDSVTPNIALAARAVVADAFARLSKVNRALDANLKPLP